MSLLRAIGVGCVVASACAVGPSALAEAASFTPIGGGDADPNEIVVLWGLSGDGRVAVGQRSCLLPCSGNGTTEAIRWSEAAGIERLELLAGGSYESVAFGANDDGSVVVGYSNSPTGYAAFRWRSETGFERIDPGPPLENDRGYSAALATAADGSVVAGQAQVVASDPLAGELRTSILAPFVWREAAGLRALPMPDPGGWSNGATGVSDDGRTLVGWVRTSRGEEAFLLDEVAGMKTLGGIGEPGIPSDAPVSTRAAAISADGTTVVGSQTIDFVDLRFVAREPFLYTRESGMQRLVDPALRWATSEATDVSGDGSIVVGYGRIDRFDLASQAFVWDAVHGVRPLRDVLESLGIALPGWHLTAATSISRDGATIVGTASDPEGRSRSFIAVIPEPGPAVLVGTGLAALATGRGAGRPWRAGVARSSGPERERASRPGSCRRRV